MVAAALRLGRVRTRVWAAGLRGPDLAAAGLRARADRASRLGCAWPRALQAALSLAPGWAAAGRVLARVGRAGPAADWQPAEVLIKF